MRTPLAFLAAVAVVTTAHAADKPNLAAGNYRLVYLPRPMSELPMAVLKVETDEGKTNISTLDGGQNKAEASELVATDAGVKFAVVLAGGAAKLTFEGKPDPNDPKRVLGSLGDDTRIFPAELTPTDTDKLDARPKPPELPAALRDAQKLTMEATMLRGRMLREKDADAKAKLRDEANEAAIKAETETPALYKQVIADQPGTTAAVIAAGELLDRLDKLNVTPEEAKAWAEESIGYAAKYGPRIERAARIKVAEAFAGSDKLAESAVPFAEPVAKSDAPTGDRLKAYKALAVAYRKSGQADLVETVKTEIDKIKLVLDQEYLEKVPPFKPAKFKGRKDAEANRVAVFELFTGAQCPPCVASDVGFDALLKAYKPTDVVLLQYHMHIPGPDPLTNPTSLARWEYYQDKFPKDMRGTPSTLVNGKPGAGDGGSMANAERKFDEFRKLIDPTLEDKTEVSLDGSAKRAGEEIMVTVAVTSGKDVSDTAALKLFLVDENVRYLGGNGVRFHHHLVRATIGDPAGVKLTELKEGKQTATIRIPDVRKSLEDYLDEAAKERTFPSPERPTEFGTLKVVALVQDDEGAEVLQAVELPITGG